MCEKRFTVGNYGKGAENLFLWKNDASKMKQIGCDNELSEQLTTFWISDIRLNESSKVKACYRALGAGMI